VDALISFIVIAYNARQTIRQCLASILAQEIAKQIILVDNASTDETVLAVADLPVLIVTESHKNRGAARNQGLQHATGDFIAFVDSDVELPRQWAQDALALLVHNPDIVAVGGPGLTPSDSWVSLALDVQQYGTHLDCETHRVPSLPTMNVLYRGNAIRAERFENFWTAEDAEFNFRLGARGYKFLWSRDLAVTHHHVTTLGQLIRKSFQYGMWYLAPYSRHPKMMDWGVVARIAFFPAILFLFVGGALCIPFVVGGTIAICLPLLAYAMIAARSRLLQTTRSKIQFVIVHSAKQYAQMAGIWAGVLNGMVRAFRK
jgi:glycosyltransferase involved in cell wall biosynthesis